MAVTARMLPCKGHNSPILNCSGEAMCDIEKATNNKETKLTKDSKFYESKSPFAYFPPDFQKRGKEPFGLIPYCKDCTQKIFEYYYDNGKNQFDTAVYYTCQKLDIPFILEIFNGIVNDVKEKETTGEFGGISKKYMGLYINRLNIGKIKYKDKTDFSCSDNDLSDIDMKIAKRDMEKKEAEAFELDWGMQEERDYALLEYDFASLTDGMSLTKPQEMLYRDLCLARLAKRKAEQLKDDTDKDKKTASVQQIQTQILGLMKTLRIDNFSENKELSIVDRMLETRIAIQEKEKPAFHYQDIKINADYMGRGKDIYNHIYRPFKNVIRGSKEYTISNLDEEDEYYEKLMSEEIDKEV